MCGHSCLDQGMVTDNLVQPGLGTDCSESRRIQVDLDFVDNHLGLDTVAGWDTDS